MCLVSEPAEVLVFDLQGTGPLALSGENTVQVRWLRVPCVADRHESCHMNIIIQLVCLVGLPGWYGMSSCQGAATAGQFSMQITLKQTLCLPAAAAHA